MFHVVHASCIPFMWSFVSMCEFHVENLESACSLAHFCMLVLESLIHTHNSGFNAPAARAARAALLTKSVSVKLASAQTRLTRAKAQLATKKAGSSDAAVAKQNVRSAQMQVESLTAAKKAAQANQAKIQTAAKSATMVRARPES
jgi:multidrug resistance efflux pump